MKRPLGQTLHRSIMKLFRECMLVGEMSQAVEQYAVKYDFQLVSMRMLLLTVISVNAII